MSVSNADAQAELKKVYDKLAQNPFVWGGMFFSHHIRDESPRFHVDLMRAAMGESKVAIAAPRESAKSTMLTFVYPFHQIIFKKKKFIIIVGNTFEKACEPLDTIKKEMADNEMLRNSFRGIKITKDAKGDSEFRHKDGFETRVLCKGVEQIGSIRGVKFKAYRPDLIIGDDMEDDELVRSSSRRVELQKNFDQALIPAGEFGKCQYIFIGTIMHDDCQLAKLLSEDQYTEYYKMKYQALQEDGTSIWPEKWSVEVLKEMQKDKPDVFAKEYQNDPVSGQNVRFKREDFRYWSVQSGNYQLKSPTGEIVGSGSLSHCKAAISVDLAWKERRTADSSVIMPGYLTPDSELLIEDYIHEKGMRPDRLAEILFSMVNRLEGITGSSVFIGFEKAMLENVSQWLLREEMKKRNKFLITKELKWDADKNTRIETRLQPRYSQHVVFHKGSMGDLEYELERFPYGAHDDLIDAEQGLVQLLQTAPAKKKPTETSNQFNWWRDKAKSMREKPKPSQFTGVKRRNRIEIKAKDSWR